MVGLFLVLPVLNVFEYLDSVDVWHIVVLGQLVREVRLASAGLAGKGNLERLQAAHFAELILNELDVAGKTCLAVPVEITVAGLCTLFRLLTNEEA